MLLGRGVNVFEDLQSALDTSDGRTGGTALNAGRMRGGGGEGLGGKKCCSSVLLIWAGVVAFLSTRKRSGAFPITIFLAFHTDRESRLSRNCDHCTLLATWIALKYELSVMRAWAGEA